MYAFIKRIVRTIFSRNNGTIAGYNKKEFGKLGNYCRIGSDCILVPRNMYLDDYVIIQGRNNFISYNGKLIIKKYSVISSSCIIIPSNHVLSVGIPFYLNTISHVGDEDHTIVINEDVWIGAGCKILPRSSFGRGCIVGTGSIVTKDIPPYAVVAGCPAKIIAVKFSKLEIVEHEKRIYPQNERLTMQELDTLFNQYYKDVKPLKSYDLTVSDRTKLNDIINNLYIDFYYD